MWNSFQLKYKLIKKIGEGSFSEVLQCEERATGTQVAAKRLKKIYKSKEEIDGCAELIASKKISWHPNVLNMIEFFFDTFAGKVIFIFELMDMSMYDYIKSRTQTLREYKVKRYLYQILRGLNHLHKSGLFHRDVKPENILIKFQACHESYGPDLIKIADLGSVRGTYSVPPYTEYISTRWYRSPECLLTVGQYGPKMDVWATGCVFYEMILSKPLFPGKNEVDQLHKIHDILGTPTLSILKKLKNKSLNYMKFEAVRPKGIESVTKELSTEAVRVLKLMIQYDPDKRINVGRLLHNDYFEEFNSQLPKLKHRQRMEGECIKKMLLPTDELKRHKNSVWSKGSKGSKQDSKGSEGSDIRRKKKLIQHQSKTSIDITDYMKHQKRQNSYKLRESTKPLVNMELLKSWGVNPNILKPLNPNRERSDGNRFKSRLQKKSEPEQFRRTTSNLPQLIKPLLQSKDIKKREFQSQSLVPHWRISCNLLPENKSRDIKADSVKRSQIKRKLIKRI